MPRNPELSHEQISYQEVSPKEERPILSFTKDSIAYQGKEHQLFLYNDGRIAVDRKENFLDPSSKEGQEALAEAKSLEERDRLILQARDEYARELANGDPLLEVVMNSAVHHADGHEPTPWKIDDINMYEVSGNASHIGYLGVKDDRLFFLCSGPETYVFRDSEHDMQLPTDELIKNIVEEIAFKLSVDHIYDANIDELEDLTDDKLETLETDYATKYGEKIKKALEPHIMRFKKTGDVTEKNNRIRIELDGFSISVFVKPLLEDITDRDEVYLGRGYIFRPKQELSKKVSSQGQKGFN